MKHRIFLKQLSYAALLGIVTILCCLVLADGIIGMDVWHFDARDLVTLPGRIVFWVFIIGLPIYFSKFTRPLYTLINLPIFYLLYFPVKAFFDHLNVLYWHEDLRSMFMYSGGFNYIPAALDALIMATAFFVIEFVVLAAACLIRRYGGKQRENETV